MTTETAAATSFAAAQACPDLTREEALTIYRDMVLGRRFEDKCAEMYYRGKMFGFVHLYNGQEAVSSGVIKAMKTQHDWFCSTYRDHVHAPALACPPVKMSELFGKETGCSKGRGGSMHLFSKEHHLLGGYAFIGEGIPVALGAAFTSRYKRDALGDSTSNAVTAAFFGDGTCNIGQFYECLNMASCGSCPSCLWWRTTSGPSAWPTTAPPVTPSSGARPLALACTAKRSTAWMCWRCVMPPSALWPAPAPVKAPPFWSA